MQNADEIEVIDFKKNELDPEDKVDILVQAGMEKPEKAHKKINFTAPTIISREEFEKQMQLLNEKQRMIVMHILQLIKCKSLPFHIFLSGSAGVGKSTVINAIHQSISLYYNSLPGKLIDVLHVLLCAPSGMAAHNIGGQTLHAAFALPINQFAGQMPDLSDDTANSIREKLFHTKLLIIDEVSMVGARQLSRVDTRLQQIKGINKPFGDISVLIVGDLNQLAPVMDFNVFRNPEMNCLNTFHVSPLWSLFDYYPLTEIMRQKDESAFINALNNLAVGQMTDEDIRLIRSRIVKESDVPESAIRLFSTNKLVNEYNHRKIMVRSGNGYVSEAYDDIKDNMDTRRKEKLLDVLKKMDPMKTGGLRYSITFKIGIKYMLISNLDVGDGLVNGACGVLRRITLNDSDQPSILWIDFGVDRVGHKLKLKYKDYTTENRIPTDWVPIMKHVLPINIQNNVLVTRKQFPLVAAEAITIHKSQGQTYTEICLDLQRNRCLTRSLLYVALSRVTNLDGLYIIGNFNPPKSPGDSDRVIAEIHRLEREKMLTISAYESFNSYDFNIAFHNVRSLKKNIENIMCDKWYLSSNVLIFVETGTIYSDVVVIPGYDLFYRSDGKFSSRKPSRGIMVFTRNDICRKIILQSDDEVEYDEKDKYVGHFDLVCLSINDMIIIAGYISPKVRFSTFQRAMESFSTHIKCGHTVLMGDFNIDIYDKVDHPMKDFMRKYGLISLLPMNVSTTSFNTQIDVLFTDVQGSKSSVYTSYFSDHVPILFSFNKNAKPDEAHDHAESSDNKGVFDEGCIVTSLSHSFSAISLDSKQFDIDVISIPSSISEEMLVDVPIIQIDDLHDDHAISRNRGNNLPQSEIYIIEHGLKLTDLSINAFHDLLKEFSRDNRNVMNEYCFIPHGTYECDPRWRDVNPVELGTSHIQIMFAGDTENPNAVGHWLTSYYDGSVLHIYDSSSNPEDRYLYPNVNIFLDRLFPYKPPKCFHRVQQQTNGDDCGVFAIAFAVSAYLQQDLDHVKYDIRKMRRHLLNMFDDWSISPFPSL